MEQIRMTDMTLRTLCENPELTLSFKEKLEIARCLSRMNPDVLELPKLENKTTDALLVRTIAGDCKDCTVSVPAGYSAEEADLAWAAVSAAAHPRLCVSLPLSTVQMEYLCRKKPAAVLELAASLTAHCVSLGAEVEFRAGDATRAEPEFLRNALKAAIQAGADVITVSDTAGQLLPEEFTAFLQDLLRDVPELKEKRLGVLCSSELRMAEACAVSAIRAGAREVCVIACRGSAPDLGALTAVLNARGEELGFTCGIRTMELQRLTKQIARLSHTAEETASSGAVSVSAGTDFFLNVHDNEAAVASAAIRLGYDLTPDDLMKVYEAFHTAAEKKEVSSRELEAIIASVALQVPPTYRLVTFVINSGNRMSATANIVLEKNGKELRGLCAGDGPIDASFLAIEQIAGMHYELDDFRIQAVTEGREAMGTAIVRLRSRGRIYSGNGTSTDIIAAAIYAYVSALNKIVYEEEGI